MLGTVRRPFKRSRGEPGLDFSQRESATLCYPLVTQSQGNPRRTLGGPVWFGSFKQFDYLMLAWDALRISNFIPVSATTWNQLEFSKVLTKFLGVPTLIKLLYGSLESDSFLAFQLLHHVILNNRRVCLADYRDEQCWLFNSARQYCSGWIRMRTTSQLATGLVSRMGESQKKKRVFKNGDPLEMAYSMDNLIIIEK